MIAGEVARRVETDLRQQRTKRKGGFTYSIIRTRPSLHRICYRSSSSTDGVEYAQGFSEVRI